MSTVLGKIKKVLTGDDRWEVRRTIWPYKDGWGTYNPARGMVLDTGLTKEQAQAACDELNGGAWIQERIDLEKEIDNERA